MTHRRSTSGILGLALALPLLLVAPIIGAQSPPGFEQGDEIEPVDDEELEHFVIAFVEVQELQDGLNEMTDERIEESELSERRFYEINEIAQQNDQSALSNVDDDELAEYRTVLDDILEIQNEQQTVMAEAVQEEDLTIERFNRIMLALREDQELAARAEEELQAIVDEEREGAQ
ncbi:MAG: DUF4168 domain-containing protein [Spirochaetota bacterium]